MKKIFAIILSLGLIIAPMPVAHAQGGDGRILKQLLGLGNGVVGASILTKCVLGSTQMSVNLYMLGSLAYVLGEILSGKQKAKDIDNQSANMDQLKDGMKDGGDYQKKSIQIQIDNEKSNLAFIQNRKKFITATLAIYSAATIMAMIEKWWSFPPPVGMGKPDAAACKFGNPSHKFWVLAITMGYSSLMMSGGNLEGMATSMALQAGTKLLLPKIELAGKIADKIVPMLNESIGRALFFGGMGVLVGLILEEASDAEKESKRRIADLEKVEGQFDDADNSLAEAGDLSSGKVDPSKKTYALKALPQGTTLAKNCLSTTNGQSSFSESGCKNPTKLTRPKFDLAMNLPALVAAGNSAADFTQALADGDSAKADIEAGTLAAMAGRLNAIKDELVKKTNDKLKADGKKGLDFNAEVKRQMDELGSAMNKQEAGSGNYDLADLQGGEAGISVTESPTENVMSTVSAPASIALPEGQGLDLSKIGEGGITEGDLVDPNAAGNVASLNESLNNYESTESDISKDPEVSIFKQVSNRYFLNYTKIFQRKEINPPLEEPAPAP